MSLTDRTEIERLLLKFGFSFKKSLGQNFLINPSVAPKMAEYALSGAKNAGVIEIGPGIGVLTAELSKRAEKVLSLEIDGRLLPILGDTVGHLENVEIINTDALKCDLNELAREKLSGLDLYVVANLPYNITSPMLMKLLKTLDFQNITVMVQKEAADRLCAKQGTRESSAITLAVNCYAKPKLLFNVKRGSFLPQPKVDSAVITLAPLDEKKNDRLMLELIHFAFLKRRKNILNAFESFKGFDKKAVSAILDELKLDKNLRPENLTLSDYAAVSEKISKERF